MRERIDDSALELKPGPWTSGNQSFSSAETTMRVQIFAWTIALGIIFVSFVYNNLAMPEFSATLLGLMGISSGPYIGFKFPEEK
jgi:hypothetical protein